MMEKFNENSLKKIFNFSEGIDHSKMELLLTLCDSGGILGSSKIMRKFIEDKEPDAYTKLIEKLISFNIFVTVDFVKRSEIPGGDTLVKRFEEMDLKRILEIDDYADKIKDYDSIDIY